jgi:hypothetical protein
LLDHWENINDEQSYYTAEAWAFWFMYLAPFLLKNRLNDGCFQHMCELVDIMKSCIQFTLQHDEIDALEESASYSGFKNMKGEFYVFEKNSAYLALHH